jgi:phthiocerol/phenolphthiocerol synthesis type-I polyketide synthase E
VTPPPRSLDGVVAIVGLACRFPGAAGPEELWQCLLRRRYVCADAGAAAGGISPRLERHLGFDAAFFGLPEADAAVIDPQHRQFLMCAHEALEDAGIDPWSASASIGLFAGCAPSGHLFDLLDAPSEVVGRLGARGIRHAIDKDYLTARAAYLLDLRGPCLSIQSGCATGLAALHMAGNALMAGDCDVALAGGVSIRTGPEPLQLEPEPVDPSGRCRPFDRRAGGTLYGDGVGVVVLKRASDAVAAADNIRALVLASSVNNSGANRPTFTGPARAGQVRAAQDALDLAQVDPRSVGLIEAHGSGTPLGDALEAAALDSVYGTGDAASGAPVACGSIKGSIGNLGVAAGMAGLAKAVLALQRALIPAQPDFAPEQTAAAIRDTGFYVPAQHELWRAAGPRRAAVCGYGMTGTNAHVVLEQAPEGLWEKSEPDRPRLLLISARTAEELAGMERRLWDWLRTHHELCLRDVAYTLHTGRRRFSVRAAYLMAPSERGHAASLAPYRCAEGTPRSTELARLWLQGREVSWEALYEGERPRRVSLPTYPFTERQLALGGPAQGAAIAAVARLEQVR